MSKRLVLTLSDEMFKATIEQQAKSLGISPIEYIRYVITEHAEKQKFEMPLTALSE